MANWTKLLFVVSSSRKDVLVLFVEVHDEPVGVAHQDLRYVIAVERFVLEYVDCPAVFEILAKETEDAGFWQLGFSEHADHLGRDLLGGGEFSRGGGL